MITADSERLRAFNEAARSYNDAMVGLEDPARLAEAYILYAKKVAAIAAFRSLATSHDVFELAIPTDEHINLYRDRMGLAPYPTRD